MFFIIFVGSRTPILQLLMCLWWKIIFVKNALAFARVYLCKTCDNSNAQEDEASEADESNENDDDSEWQNNINLTRNSPICFMFQSYLFFLFTRMRTKHNSKFVKLWSTTTVLKSYVWWNISKASAKFYKNM